MPEDKDFFFNHAKEIVRQVQEQASCADVAASVYGGLMLYRADPLLMQPLPLLKENRIYAVYSGYKTKTEEVLRKVKAGFQHKPALLETLMTGIEHCTQQALSYLQNEDWSSFGDCMNVAHGYLSALGVSDPKLESLVYELRNNWGALGAKISGAGLGDCVIGLGQIDSERMKKTNLTVYPIQISEVGCR